jgi:hypothetical protein
MNLFRALTEGCRKCVWQPVVSGEFMNEARTIFYPAGKPKISLSRVIMRLWSDAYGGAPKGLVKGGLKRVKYPG